MFRPATKQAKRVQQAAKLRALDAVTAASERQVPGSALNSISFVPLVQLGGAVASVLRPKVLQAASINYMLS